MDGMGFTGGPTNGASANGSEANPGFANLPAPMTMNYPGATGSGSTPSEMTPMGVSSAEPAKSTLW
jgi:hypothetical protein